MGEENNVAELVDVVRKHQPNAHDFW